jgi:hypothetical protein
MKHYNSILGILLEFSEYELCKDLLIDKGFVNLDRVTPLFSEEIVIRIYEDKSFKWKYYGGLTDNIITFKQFIRNEKLNNIL